MIKKILIFLFLFGAVSVYAQNESSQNSNVELPDFVITGKDVISVRKAHKIPPEFVSTLSEGFLKPVFPTENLGVKEISTPVKGILTTLDTLNYIKGNLDFEAGVFSVPKADFTYAAPFGSGLFEGHASANNQRAYVDNSEMYELNGGAGLQLFVKDDSKFLPGSKINFKGDFGTSGYKFYGSADPLRKRVLSKAEFGAGIQNLMGKYFIFSLSASDNLNSISAEKYSENMAAVKGFARLTLPAFNLGVDVNYKRQSLTDSLLSSSAFSYAAVKPVMGLNISDVLKVSFGFNYAKSGGSNFFAPYAAAGLKLNSAVSLYGEIAPKADLLSSGYFLNTNRFFRAQNFANVFYKQNAEFDASIKYQYFTYFEIDGGVKYFSSDNQPYFNDSAERGVFDVNTSSAKSYSAYANLLFHLGPYGIFYGTGELNTTKDPDGNSLPYYPKLKATANYGYNFNFGLNAEAGLIFTSGGYADIKNNTAINPYVNLSLKFAYKIQPQFKLLLRINNLLNRENYIWSGYKELPMDISAGVNYSW